MEVQRVEITTIAELCKDGDCPAAHLVDQKLVLFQGYEFADEAALAQLKLPAGEGVVAMTVDAARELIRQLTAKIGVV